MGNCDSSNEFSRKRDYSEYTSNFSSPSLPTVAKRPEKKDDTKSPKLTKNLSSKNMKYILPESISKRQDITEVYKLSKNIVSYGATSLLYIGENNSKEKFAVKRVVKSTIKKKQKMFIKEAELCLKLHHENIIKYYEIYEDNNFINIVMELGDADLFDVIVNSPNGVVPDLLAIDLLIQIFEVINFLHDNKIIHCDIKPENFVVKFDKNKKACPILKLIDFGNARKMSLDGEKLKNFSGTLCYMAPELFEKNGFDEKVDEWAAGILMFNMLTGCDPFGQKSESDLRTKILYNNIDFSTIKNERLRELNKKLLEKFVAKRISAREALEEIKNIKKDILSKNIFDNINNNKIENYVDIISKNLKLLSLS